MFWNLSMDNNLMCPGAGIVRSNVTWRSRLMNQAAMVKYQVVLCRVTNSDQA